jgi:sugar lactone lactonase YvrE
MSGGVMTTAVGTGTSGYSGDGGQATSAQISYPSGLAVDSPGNLYIADTNNARVRRVSPGGVITTVAGNGTNGYSGDGGLATSAQISNPSGVAVDSALNLYIADSSNARVRKVSGGVITTVAGAGPPDGSLATTISVQSTSSAVDSLGNVYIVSSPQNRVYKVATNGTITTVAGNGTNGFSGDGGLATGAQISYATGITVDSSFNLYIADSGNYRIRKVSGGVITTVVGTGTYGFSGDGGLATGAQISYVTGIAVDSSFNLYIADQGNNRIRKVVGGVITTVAGTVAGNGNCASSGDGGPATSAQICGPSGVAVDSSFNLYIAEQFNCRIRMVSVGVITTVAGNGNCGYTGDGGPATSAQISNPSGVAVDSAFNLYIADQGNRIRKVSGGVITTVAGNGNCASTGDGGPATSAQICGPSGVAVDGTGNLYIADRGNNRTRKVAAGVINTIAGNGLYSYSGDGGLAINAQLGSISALATDNSGNLFISDSGNNRVRVVSSGGTISTFAGGGTQGLGDGGPATSASLSSPRGLAVDSQHNVFIADSGNQLLRKVSGGIITSIATIAGMGSYPFSGDGGVAVDSQGDVFVSEPLDSLVRVLIPGFGITATTTVVGPISPEPSVVGRLYSVAYTVTSGGGTPVGNVTVSDGSNSSICTVTAGTCSINSTTPGPKTITVTYDGNGSFPLSFGTKSHTVYAEIPSDFTGDGRVDVLWQDPITGLAQVWLLSGAQGVTVNGSLNLTASNPWHIVGVADFNGDGHPDVVWQDPLSGAAQVWFLGGPQGNVVTGAATLSNGNSWRIMSIADFNGDGQPDVIWQDPVTGLAQIWFMGGVQGTTVTGAVNLTASNTWRIVGTGDFNQDGHPDVLWQDPVSGTTQIWYLGGSQGNVVTNAVNLSGSNPWRIASVADFNLDGHPDVVFQDPISGASQVWFLGGTQGTTITGTAALSGSNSWRIVGPR